MFVKVNNKVTSKTSLTSFCCLYLLTLNIICSFLVSLLHFWAGKCLLGTLILFKLSWGQFLWIETGNLCYVINVNPEATHHLSYPTKNFSKSMKKHQKNRWNCSKSAIKTKDWLSDWNYCKRLSWILINDFEDVFVCVYFFWSCNACHLHVIQMVKLSNH